MKPPFEITLAQTTYELRYTPGALMAIEKHIGKSVLKFIEHEGSHPDELMKIETMSSFVFRGIQRQLKDGRGEDFVMDNLPINEITDMVQTILSAVMHAYGYDLDELDAEAPSDNGAKKKVKAK